MQQDLHERFDLSDVEVASAERIRLRERRDTIDDLDALVAELKTEYRLAS